MNYAHLSVKILSVKEFDNEENSKVFSGTAQFSWTTGVETSASATMSFYACGIEAFNPQVGETYELRGRSQIKKTPVEEGGAGSNQTLHMIVKGASLPLISTPQAAPQATPVTTPEPAPIATKTTTKGKTTPAKQLVTVGGDSDMDDIPF